MSACWPALSLFIEANGNKARKLAPDYAGQYDVAALS